MNTIEESEEPKSISFKQSFGIVLGIHALAIGGIIYASLPKAHAEDKAFLKSPEAQYTGIPEPIPNRKEITPDGKIATYPKPIEEKKSPEVKKEVLPVKNKVNSKYSQTYKVKKGDTIYSISKKYHLNTKKLLQLNHNTDSSKLRVGQVLKFL
jgi:LysM repeat protein